MNCFKQTRKLKTEPKEKEVKDEFDLLLEEKSSKPLTERLGMSPLEIEKEAKELKKNIKEKTLKQTKISFKPQAKVINIY